MSKATGKVAACRVLRRGTELGVTGMLPPTLPAGLERHEGQEQMDGFGGEQGGREVGRERKQSKGNKIRTALQAVYSLTPAQDKSPSSIRLDLAAL